MRISDWSSDVCSSDLLYGSQTEADGGFGVVNRHGLLASSRVGSGRRRGRVTFQSSGQSSGKFSPLRPPIRSEERRVGKECVSSVDLGGRRIIKKKKE